MDRADYHLFPDAFPGVLGESLTGRALKDRKWALETIDLRRFGDGKHRNVDDTPAGGGAGMVLRADVVGNAIDHAIAQSRAPRPLIYLSPRGKRFDQKMAQDWSKLPGLIMLWVGSKGSINGCWTITISKKSRWGFCYDRGRLAAQAMIDATVRLLPDVLGNADSTVDESHSNGLLEHPNTPALPNGWAAKFQRC